jgi:hypothetical protein
MRWRRSGTRSEEGQTRRSFYFGRGNWVLLHPPCPIPAPPSIIATAESEALERRDSAVWIPRSGQGPPACRGDFHRTHKALASGIRRPSPGSTCTPLFAPPPRTPPPPRPQTRASPAQGSRPISTKQNPAIRGIARKRSTFAGVGRKIQADSAANKLNTASEMRAAGIIYTRSMTVLLMCLAHSLSLFISRPLHTPRVYTTQ